MESKSPGPVAITIDTEWAPEQVLRDTIELLDRYGTDATMFSTHEDGLSLGDHERALHPNFFVDREDEHVLRELSSEFPEAIGVRSHGMYIYTDLRTSYQEVGIEYESNYLAYLQNGIEPFTMPDGTIQFPVYWMDDQWLRFGDRTPVDFCDYLDSPGMKVFDFHPPHIAFNTPTIEYYEGLKEEYYESGVDISAHQAGSYGVRDVFTGLLDYIDRNNVETALLGDLSKEYQIEKGER